MTTTRPQTSRARDARKAPRRTDAPGPGGPEAEESDLLRTALDEAVRLIGASGGMVYLHDEERDDLRFALDVGISGPGRAWVRRLRLPYGVGMFGRSAAEREVIVTGDYGRDESFPHTRDADRVVAVVGIRSMVVAPLLAGDRTLGAFGVFCDRPAAFGPGDIALVRTLAAHAATSIANRRLIADLDRSREAESRRAAVERALREIAARISAVRDTDALLQLVVDEAARLLDADGARIDLLDETTGVLSWAYDARTGRRRGLGPITGAGEAGSGEGISGRAIVERRAVRTDDYLHDDRFVHASAPDAHARRHRIVSALAAPLLADDDPLGTLTVYTSRRGAFGPDDEAVITALASQAGLAIRKARLFDELARSREETARRADSERTLREVGARVAAERDPEAVLHLIAAEAARLLGHDRVFINLLDDPTGAAGWTWYSPKEVGRDDWPADEAIRLGEGVTGKAIAERRTFITGDYLHDARFVHRPGPDRYTAALGLASAMAVPMYDGDVPLGAMLVEGPEPDAFDESDALLLEALAQQASIALANARLIDALARSREETARRADAERTLREIASRVTTIHDPAGVLQEILDQAARLLGGERAQLDLVEPIGGSAQWTHPPGASASRRPGGVPRSGVGGWALRESRPVWTGDYLADPSFRHAPGTDRFVRAVGLRSIVAAPLVADEQLVGVIQIGSGRPDAFGPEDGALLASLATVAAVGIANVRLIAELDRSRDEVARRADAERTLREISGRLTTLREPSEVLQRVVEEAVRLLGARGGVIDLLDPATGLFEWSHDVGVPAVVRDEWVARRAGEPIVKRAAMAGGVVRTNDYATDARFAAEAPDRAFFRRAGVRSLVIAPLVGEDVVLGTLAVFADRPGRWGPEDAELLRVLADQAAIAVANARLIDELGRSREELSRRVDRERALREIAARITALGEPGEVLQQIVEESLRLLDSDGAHLTLMADDGTYVYPVVIAGGADEATQAWMRTQRFPIDGGLNGLAAGLGEAVWTRDYLLDPRIPHEPDDQEVAGRMRLRGMAAAPLRAPEGEVVGTLAISYAEPRDILPAELELLQGLADHAAIALTNSRLLERVQRSEARYRFLVENSPDIVFSADREGRFTFVSDSVERLLGYRSDELVGRDFSSIVDEASLPFATQRWAEAAAEPGRQVSARLELRHRDGRRILYEINALGFVRDGVFQGVHGSSRDISERERLQRELGESEARYRDLVQSSPDGVWQADADGRFTFWSDTASALLGWAPEQVVGRHWEAVVSPASRGDAEAAWAELAGGPSTLVRVRLMLSRTEEGDIPAEVSAVPVFRDGAFAGAHGSVRDLRDRERLERDLRRQAGEIAASEERAHLARELHDSVTQALFSMTLVTRSIELLLQRDPAAAAEKLASLRELQRDALAEMRSLIFELRPGSLEQDGLVRALRTHAAALEGRVGMPILIEADDLPRLPIAIEDACYRIAQEALHNVVKHAGAHEVRIRLELRGDRLQMTIHDDGQGFEPTDVRAGHLGLAGMRARAERIGGSVSIRSRPGSGTRVELVVPTSGGEPRPAPVGGSRPTASAGTDPLDG